MTRDTERRIDEYLTVIDLFERAPFLPRQYQVTLDIIYIIYLPRNTFVCTPWYSHEHDKLGITLDGSYFQRHTAEFKSKYQARRALDCTTLPNDTETNLNSECW